MPWREWSDLRSLSGLLGIKWSCAWSSQSQVKQYTPKVLSWPICKSQVVTKLLACSQLDSCIWSYEQNNPELIMYFNAAITSYLWLTISTNLQILIIPKFWPSWILNKNDSTVIKLNVFFCLQVDVYLCLEWGIREGGYQFVTEWLVTTWLFRYYFTQARLCQETTWLDRDWTIKAISVELELFQEKVVKTR